jgi:uncharacterized protein
MPRVKPLLAWGALALAACYTAAAGYLYWQQDWLIYPRTVAPVAAPNATLTPYEPLSLTAPDGTALHGILFPPTVSPTVAGATSPTLIVVFGGNAQDAVGLATTIRHALPTHTNTVVAALAYRGYPQALGTPSGGQPSQKALLNDAALLTHTLRQRWQPGATLAVGYSLGSAVATGLAQQVSSTQPLQGLVLLAPPASIARLAAEAYPWLPVRWLLRSPWPTENWLQGLQVPLLVAYSPTDGLIPPHHITLLQAAQPSATFVPLPGSVHGNVPRQPALVPLLQGFVAHHGQAASTPQGPVKSIPHPAVAPFPAGGPGATTPSVSR